MDLNDLEKFKLIDHEKMLDHIDGLPIQLKSAWNLGLTLPLPEMRPMNRVIVAGMGGSAIGADLAGSFLSDRLSVPMNVHRDYDLPAYARGKETLVIISSHSGNTEESLSAFEQAHLNGCQLLVICTGGNLKSASADAGVPAWTFNHIGQPRTAVGYSFGLLLALFFRLGLVSDLTEEVEDTVNVMSSLQTRIAADVPVLSNPAKRLAGQMIGRHVTVFGSGFLVPVARRWKSQINEVSKAVASFEALPEADHNTLAGIYNPQGLLGQELAIFLKASADHPRNQKRLDATREIMMLEGVGTDFFNAKGKTRMEQMWSAILFGDYVSYYLAMAYETDPTPIPPITDLKERMSQ